MKNQLWPFAFLLLVISCKGTADKEQKASETKSASFIPKDLVGVFSDTIPCADCAGILTSLYLRPDTTYVLEQDYLGAKSEEHVFYDIGRWSVTDSIIKLTQATEGPKQYKIIDATTIKILDNERKVIADTSLSYNLGRITIPFRPKQPITVSGLYRADKDTISLFICNTGKTYPASLAPTALSLQLQYNKLDTGQLHAPIMARLEGRFELKPLLKGTGTEDFFVVTKLVKFLPGESCKSQ